jgi:opine dehydrogenase
MSAVAVLGAGAGGTAAAVELMLGGHEVRLWNRRAETLVPLRAAGGISYEGVLGNGQVNPALITDDIPAALDGAAVATICLPALAHESVARLLASGVVLPPIVLNPGHTGGALHFRAVFAALGKSLPPLAELSTLTYVARKPSGARVTISGVANRVWVASLEGGDEAVAWARKLWRAPEPASDVLATALANVNLVLHPPGAVLAAAWVEATGGDFRFYVDAMTPGVARVLAALDRERLAVADAFGHKPAPLIEEMAAIGTADAEAARKGDIVAAIALGEANRAIRAPESLQHRYYQEDFGYALLPFVELARIAGVETPLASSLLHIGDALAGGTIIASGLSAERLGLAGFDRDRLLQLVRTKASR